jgi:hypothetical protein
MKLLLWRQMFALLRFKQVEKGIMAGLTHEAYRNLTGLQ